MSTTKCSNCGCEDSFLTSPAPCPTPAACPDPEPCYTVTDSQCTIYTGADIDCGQDTVVAMNTSLADALNDIIAFFCEYVVETSIARTFPYLQHLEGTLHQSPCEQYSLSFLQLIWLPSGFFVGGFVQ